MLCYEMRCYDLGAVAQDVLCFAMLRDDEATRAHGHAELSRAGLLRRKINSIIYVRLISREDGILL